MIYNIHMYTDDCHEPKSQFIILGRRYYDSRVAVPPPRTGIIAGLRTNNSSDRYWRQHKRRHQTVVRRRRKLYRLARPELILRAACSVNKRARRQLLFVCCRLRAVSNSYRWSAYSVVRSSSSFVGWRVIRVRDVKSYGSVNSISREIFCIVIRFSKIYCCPENFKFQRFYFIIFPTLVVSGALEDETSSSSSIPFASREWRRRRRTKRRANRRVMNVERC